MAMVRQRSGFAIAWKRGDEGSSGFERLGEMEAFLRVERCDGASA